MACGAQRHGANGVEANRGHDWPGPARLEKPHFYVDFRGYFMVRKVRGLVEVRVRIAVANCPVFKTQLQRNSREIVRRYQGSLTRLSFSTKPLRNKIQDSPLFIIEVVRL